MNTESAWRTRNFSAGIVKTPEAKYVLSEGNRSARYARSQSLTSKKATCIAAAHNQVDEFVRHSHSLYYALAVQKLRDFRIGQNAFRQGFLVEPCLDEHSPFHAAVHLHHDFHLIFRRELWNKLWPRGMRERVPRVAEY